MLIDNKKNNKLGEVLKENMSHLQIIKNNP